MEIIGWVVLMYFGLLKIEKEVCLFVFCIYKNTVKIHTQENNSIHLKNQTKQTSKQIKLWRIFT